MLIAVVVGNEFEDFSRFGKFGILFRDSLNLKFRIEDIFIQNSGFSIGNARRNSKRVRAVFEEGKNRIKKEQIEDNLNWILV